jgi:hypothetical protein
MPLPPQGGRVMSRAHTHDSYFDDDDTHIAECACGRGTYPACCYSSCYDCYLDRLSRYVACIYCDRWHGPEFDTCFECAPKGRDEAAQDLKLVIFARDGFRCRYCGVRDGDLQHDPRLVRPKCPPDCTVEHNHRWPCKFPCRKRHKHLRPAGPGVCRPRCRIQHDHRPKDDDGIRPAKLHVDHIQPCRHGGTAGPWNLQTLCGVCNIAKGADWIPGSRHHQARRHIMAAYLTYLRGYLTADEQDQLDADAKDDGLTMNDAAKLTAAADYVQRVKARRPRPDALPSMTLGQQLELAATIRQRIRDGHGIGDYDDLLEDPPGYLTADAQ